MKEIILFIAFTGLIFSTNAQETLKFKTINTYYGEVVNTYYSRIGQLDGAVINMDTLSVLFPELSVVNISNDTFSSDVRYEVTMDFLLYADTGLLLLDRNISLKTPLFMEFFPNDTANVSFMSFIIVEVLDYLKGEGIELEHISYWEMITGISYTSQDGTYSEEIFYEGADTSIFQITKTPVNIKELKNELIDIFIFPNPAQSQFTITNTENAEICLYNLLGQKVKQITNTEANTIVQTEDLPAGIYVLKVEKGNGVVTKKVQVTK